jgi:dephospho-CoA kinase
MVVLGLTGSVGMGKSTAARMLRRLRVPVYDADAAVHRLLGPGGRAVAAVARAFPGAAKGNRIDRPALGRLVFDDRTALKRLERILHPQVRVAQARFLAACRRRRAPVAVLDIPLLFETAGENRCEGVIVVSAPPWLQRARVLQRPSPPSSASKCPTRRSAGAPAGWCRPGSGKPSPCAGSRRSCARSGVK